MKRPWIKLKSSEVSRIGCITYNTRKSKWAKEITIGDDFKFFNLQRIKRHDFVYIKYWHAI